MEREATGALAAKQAQLADEAAPSQPTRPAGAQPDTGAQRDAGTAPDATAEIALVNPDGLHARPAATLVSAVSEFTASVTVTNLRSGAGPASANSPSR